MYQNTCNYHKCRESIEATVGKIEIETKLLDSWNMQFPNSNLEFLKVLHEKGNSSWAAFLLKRIDEWIVFLKTLTTLKMPFLSFPTHCGKLEKQSNIGNVLKVANFKMSISLMMIFWQNATQEMSRKLVTLGRSFAAVEFCVESQHDFYVHCQVN